MRQLLTLVMVLSLISCRQPAEEPSTLAAAADDIKPLPKKSERRDFCGVETYKAKEDAACGVKTWRNLRSASCGGDRRRDSCRRLALWTSAGLVDGRDGERRHRPREGDARAPVHGRIEHAAFGSWPRLGVPARARRDGWVVAVRQTRGRRGFEPLHLPDRRSNLAAGSGWVYRSLQEAEASVGEKADAALALR